MLKLPKNLPPLEMPSFVLANPEWTQLGLLSGLLLVPLAVMSWVGWLMLGGAAASAHYAAAAVMALVLVAGCHPRNWRRWVTFAADRRGIYLPTYRGVFHFVPWGNVGASRIGIAGIGSNRQRTVILMLKVDDDTWAALLGGRKRRVNAPADAQGFRPFGIGNAGQDVDATQSRIEALRASSLTAL